MFVRKPYLKLFLCINVLVIAFCQPLTAATIYKLGDSHWLLKIPTRQSHCEFSLIDSGAYEVRLVNLQSVLDEQKERGQKFINVKDVHVDNTINERKLLEELIDSLQTTSSVNFSEVDPQQLWDRSGNFSMLPIEDDTLSAHILGPEGAVTSRERTNNKLALAAATMTTLMLYWKTMPGSVNYEVLLPLGGTAIGILLRPLWDIHVVRPLASRFPRMRKYLYSEPEKVFLSIVLTNLLIYGAARVNLAL